MHERVAHRDESRKQNMYARSERTTSRDRVESARRRSIVRASLDSHAASGNFGKRFGYSLMPMENV